MGLTLAFLIYGVCVFEVQRMVDPAPWSARHWKLLALIAGIGLSSVHVYRILSS